MAQCVRNDRHSDATDIAEELAQRFASRKFKYGWNSQSAQTQQQTDIVWHDVLDVKAANGVFQFRIPWRNGRLRLVPVVKRKYSTRGLGLKGGPPQVSMILQGMWSQDNGYGCVELIFDDDGQAVGAIGVMTASLLDTKAFIRSADLLPPR
jgi:hypothetical protein